MSVTALSSPIVVACNSSKYGTIQQFNSSNWGYEGKFKPTVINSDSFVMGEYNGYGYLAFRPDTPWKGISKIKIYTNLIASPATEDDGTMVLLLAGGQADQYTLDGNYFISSNNDYATDNPELFRLFLNNIITGTAVTGSTEYTSANIGDAGTLWAEKVAYSDQYDSDVRLGANVGTTIGNQPLNNNFPYPRATGSYYDSNDNYFEIYRGDPCLQYYSSYISFQIKPFVYNFDYGTIPDFKFRFIIEYYQ